MDLSRLKNGFRSLSSVLARVNTAVLLTAVFLLAVVPVGLLLRLLRRPLLDAGIRGSSWTTCPEPSPLEKPF